MVEKERLVCGTDLGKSGAIVMINEKAEINFMAVMPVIKSTTAKDEFDLHKINYIFRQWQPTLVAIEKPLLIPVSGKLAYFNNGFGAGLLSMACVANGIPFQFVNPRTWQDCMFKGLAHTDTKQASIMWCKNHYPNTIFTIGKAVKEHTGLTDALCLANYALRELTNYIPTR